MDIRAVWKRVVSDIKSYYLGILLFGIWNIVVRVIFDAFCPFLIVTGLPCAGCGMTRAVYHILTGSFARGMKLNPAAPLWILWVALFLGNRYIRGKKCKWLTGLLCVTCMVTLVIYVYRMITQFPGDPPMTYYRNNLLSKYGAFFHDLLQSRQGL